jgi:hypothetical protein
MPTTLSVSVPARSQLLTILATSSATPDGLPLVTLGGFLGISSKKRRATLATWTFCENSPMEPVAIKHQLRGQSPAKPPHMLVVIRQASGPIALGDRAHQGGRQRGTSAHNRGREAIWRWIYRGLCMASWQGDLMWYRAGADLVVVVHLLFIGFIVGGVFLTWRWPLIIWAHIPTVVYGALVEFAGFTCPLTLLENDLRQRAGEAGYRDGFIAHYLVKVIYPPGLTHGMQAGLGVLLLLVAIIGYWGFLRRHGASLGQWLAAGTWDAHPTSRRCGRSLLYAQSVSCTRTQGDSAH